MQPLSVTSVAAPVRHKSRLGHAWLLFCLALALHVLDEALTGFLAVYNPTVLEMRQVFGYWPMPAFEFKTWLTGLGALLCLMLGLAPYAYYNSKPVRPFFYFSAIVIGIANALGHTLGTITGQTFSDITFPRPAPGFYSSPFLFAAAVYLLVQLRRTR